MEITIGDKVKCTKGYPSLLEEGKEYEIALIVYKWRESSNKYLSDDCSHGVAYVLKPYDGSRYYPHIWDASRFSYGGYPC